VQTVPESHPLPEPTIVPFDDNPAGGAD
jgi:hypothetical protein